MHGQMIMSTAHCMRVFLWSAQDDAFVAIKADIRV